MIARWLLGPAGSGKTFRCLTEARAALREAPDGRPLLFITPKQATFQLERQLLADPMVPGYTRLRILSFERLAEFVLDSWGASVPPLLGEPGRLMVLRALLVERQEALRCFRGSAATAGFAQELSQTLRELRQHGIGAGQLRRLAGEAAGQGTILAGKLHDLALLLEAYEGWLDARGLQDEQALLDAATRTLRERLPTESAGSASPAFAALWLDGFAEMTPQEADLLAALVPHCGRATLAFCLPAAPVEASSWLSGWALVEQSYLGLRDRLKGRRGIELVEETLIRSAGKNRFSPGTALAHLEAAWNAPAAFNGDPGPGVRSLACRDPETEVVAAAREILRFVRAGGRFRDAAVIVRSLEPYRPLIQRVFQRYEIPCFLDCRESVAHHPLVELTRTALRVVGLGWRNEDWFAALKTGLLPVAEADIDALENEALGRGWEGTAWRRPVRCPDDPARGERLEALRRRLVTPFLRLASELGNAAGPDAALGAPAESPTAGEPSPDGRLLAIALHAFWRRLRVDRTLAQWSESPGRVAGGRSLLSRPQVHGSVLEQMIEWLRNLALAFAGNPQPLRAWFTVLEAGLANLSVGAIPPSLDQVLVGAIDRSRNPDLRLALVLGLNESGFPAVPPPHRLLTEADRAELVGRGLALSPNRQWRLGRERYYGYIACTRASERLILTHAQQEADGRAVNPSAFIDHVQRLFPALQTEAVAGTPDWRDSVHPVELTSVLLQRARHEVLATGAHPKPPSGLLDRPEFAGLVPLIEVLHDPGAAAGLRPALARRLHGPEDLRLSPTALERFAACPFQFFAHVGLRATERARFEADPRQLGSFAHAVLAQFHAAVRAEGRQWRDLTPDEAEARIEAIAARTRIEFGHGVLEAGARDRFVAQVTGRNLVEFVRTTVDWLRAGNRLDPAAVELRFGGREARFPAWTAPLGNGVCVALTGQIDRVDLASDPATGRRLAVIIDYKSGARSPDPVLMRHGLQLQLPLYLRAFEQLAAGAEEFGPGAIEPVGMFYAGLRPERGIARDRAGVWTEATEDRRRAWQHRGRFVLERLDWLDGGSPGEPGAGQFSFAKNRKPNGNYRDPVSADEFKTLLDEAEEAMKAFARRIVAGETRVDPYRRGLETACDRCLYAAVCRIDRWTHRFRVLAAGKE
ncbi:MAG: PD-(D/E)XK nuclease family protein [Verrucomicrobiales bacterium]|nr:PD-(D/E)XK nuclease family protein [Verrucomicrobiales bacterium]